MIVRRHLLELGFGLLALAVVVPLTWQEFAPGGGDAPARAAEARDVLTPGMLAPASTANRCERGRVELTFDDGPDAYTPQVLEVLRAHDARAVFYVTGEKAAARPGLVREIVAEGHRVENHSWNHPHLTDLTPAQVRRQLADTSAAIEKAGAPRPTLLRPPSGPATPRWRRRRARSACGWCAGRSTRTTGGDACRRRSRRPSSPAPSRARSC
ncbi:polysaccharide deacetylase family protein [Actinomadura sp. WMMB 499]|uniref:polysaccharide deacetylase family protein n=1 Tax=Actinomadura sp. WMMB 499 TaxID=1219491 RepID=UPI0012452C1D|nr:polysaccharide deacetylase family protein [Actinomadura sp. WMMB 499]QFG24404.1 polysaccharide deacetylase family protein [Actinomadura sp. WMMB 499]